MFKSLKQYARAIVLVRKPGSRRARGLRPTLECLEDRYVPSTFTVVNTHDSGTGSFREAILDSNAHPAASGANLIDFHLPSNSTFELLPHSAYPAITSPVVINGMTSAGTVVVVGNDAPNANGLVIDASGCTIESIGIGGFAGFGILINSNNNVVKGTSVGMLGGVDPNGTGIVIDGGGYNTIGGTTAAAADVIADNFDSGIVIESGWGNQIEGSFIGASAKSQAEGNGLDGVKIEGAGAQENVVGGAGAGAGNVISSNGAEGVVIISGAMDNTVAGNYIGTNLGGTSDSHLGNAGDGVYIGSGATENFIGTSTATTEGQTLGVGNVISGNGKYGVEITGTGTQLNVLVSNEIGTNKNGTAALGNSLGGVLIHGGASQNLVGGLSPELGNFISGNNGQGVNISGKGTSGNYIVNDRIGSTSDGTAALPNHSYNVVIGAGATGNFIGVPGAGNLISGDAHYAGVYILNLGTSQNLVQGNLIGTNADETAALKNYIGVAIAAGATTNTIGGSAAGDGNVISGNAQQGVLITGTGTNGNLVEGNQIGTNAGATIVLKNLVGVTISAGAERNTIGGTPAGDGNVISGNTQQGILITDAGTTGNVVEGNEIGTNQAGMSAIPNGFSGVAIANGASRNTVGGTSQAAGNIISGNTNDGIDIAGVGTDKNVVEENLIGTNALGTGALGNAYHGVIIRSGAANNTVGGGNVISGNAQEGVVLDGVGTTGNVVQNNLIGLNINGNGAVGNLHCGVFICLGASANSVDANFISGNGGDGVCIINANTEDNAIHGNYIGVEEDKVTPLANNYGVFIAKGSNNNIIGGPGNGNTIADNTHAGVAVTDKGSVDNTISQNSIYGNGGLGIDLGNMGAQSVNSPGGPHSGPNAMQNYPVLTNINVSGSSDVLNGTLNSTPNTSFTIEFFSSPSGDQGKNYLGSVSVATNSSGNATFMFTFTPSSANPYLTATATDANGNASEFSVGLGLPAGA
jgi:hypothetical protein